MNDDADLESYERDAISAVYGDKPTADDLATAARQAETRILDLPREVHDMAFAAISGAILSDPAQWEPEHRAAFRDVLIFTDCHVRLGTLSGLAGRGRR